MISLPMKTRLFLALSFMISSAVSAQTLNTAWETFLKNDRKNARSQFTELSKKTEHAQDANIALSLLAETDQSGEEAFEYFSRFYEISKNPAPYLHALWRSYPLTFNDHIKNTKQLDFYNSLLKRTDLQGSMSAMANSVIGKHYEKIKKYELADKAYQQIGSLDNWQITGEFENISTSGFDKPYDVIDNPQANAIFTGKKGQQFGWRTVPFIRHDKWFDYEYYSNFKDAVIFAQTFVSSPSERNVQLRVGVSGSVKVWVNDQLMISEADERNNDLDSYINTIKLNAGNNRVLIQIGESYAGRSNFLIRLTDESGKALKDISSTNIPQSYQKETGFKAERINLLAIDFFETELKKQPENYLSQILLAKLYLTYDNVFEARKILENLKNKFPESTYINGLYIQLFTKEDNRTGVATLQEAIKAADPESPYGLTLTYNDYINQQNYNKAEDVVKKIQAIYGDNEDVTEKKLQLAGKRNNQDEIVALVEKAYPLYPHSSHITWLKYLCEKEIKKNSQAIVYLKKFVDNHDDYEVAKLLATAYLDKGDTKAGLNVYLQEINNDPIGVGVYTDLAEQYYKLQQYDKAEKYYMQALEIAPYTNKYFESLGKIYEMAKQNDKAVKSYEKSLQLNANNYIAIEALRKIQHKKDVFDYFEQPDIPTLVAKAPTLADYPDEHSVILNEEVQKVVYENGGSEEKHFYIAKVLTQKGLENLKEYHIPFFNSQSLNVEVAEVIKANGNKVPAEQNENQMIFTNLEVGDVINLRYKTQNYNTGSLAPHFWDTFYFTHGLSYISTKFSLLIHRDKPFNYKFSQKPIETQKSQKDEFDLYVWKAEHQEALIYEDKMPPMDDVANVLYLSSIPDWKFVANWYQNIATAKARSSYEIKSVIHDIFKGKEDIDQLSKVKLIYNYITQNISYSSVSFRQSGIVPQNPATVINTRIGDCKDVSTLFVTMCKEAGITAELALVKTRDNGQNTMLLPSIDFNHCIAKAVINGKDHFVELTTSTLPFGTFYNGALNAPILEINARTNAITALNPAQRTKNTFNYITQVKVDNNDLRIKESNLVTGSGAGSFREAFNHLSNKDQIKKLKESMATLYPQNDVISLSFTNLDPATAGSDTIMANTDYALMNVCKPVGGMHILALPWSLSATANQLQILGPRHFGIDLTKLFFAENSNEEMTVILPEGKKLVEPLKILNINNEYLDFSISSKLVGNNLTYTRTFNLKKDYVLADKVEDFKQMYMKMVDADQQQLALK